MPRKLINHVVIVDGASSGAYLAPAFRSHGVQCIHVISSDSLPLTHQKQFYAPDYVRTIVHRGDLEQTLAALRGYDVGVILNGQDSGLELADTLADCLGVHWRNPLHSSSARRDKFLMIDAVRRAGLLAPEQCRASSPAQLVAWTQAHGSMPVVLKPTRSAGVAGVKICSSLEQVEAAAHDILAMTSYFNERNEQIVAQSYSEGQEYIVDSVSFDGHHKLVSLWQVDRARVHAPRLDKMVVVDHNDSQYRHLVDYAFRVLDALDFRYGPSHLEIIDTKQGPTIVELNARLHGSLDPRLTTAVTGKNHVSSTVEAFLNPDHFLRTLNVPDTFSGYCGHVLLVSHGCGVLQRDFVWDAIERLPSFVSMKKWAEIGRSVEVTTDLRTALGVVGLYSEESETVLRDWKCLRQMEEEFFQDASVLTPADAAA
jgi:biotin carboxylase